jgi:hypothetical protein
VEGLFIARCSVLRRAFEAFGSFPSRAHSSTPLTKIASPMRRNAERLTHFIHLQIEKRAVNTGRSSGTSVARYEYWFYQSLSLKDVGRSSENNQIDRLLRFAHRAGFVNANQARRLLCAAQRGHKEKGSMKIRRF